MYTHFLASYSHKSFVASQRTQNTKQDNLKFGQIIVTICQEYYAGEQTRQDNHIIRIIRTLKNIRKD